MIILFNNEMLSALLRTVWSVIRMTPERHLHEIILVDDASNITGEGVGGGGVRPRVPASVPLTANLNYVCDADSLFCPDNRRERDRWRMAKGRQLAARSGYVCAGNLLIFGARLAVYFPLQI